MIKWGIVKLPVWTDWNEFANMQLLSEYHMLAATWNNCNSNFKQVAYDWILSDKRNREIKTSINIQFLKIIISEHNKYTPYKYVHWRKLSEWLWLTYLDPPVISSNRTLQIARLRILLYYETSNTISNNQKFTNLQLYVHLC